MATSFDVPPRETKTKGTLTIESWIDQGRAVVEINGELDVYTTSLLREELLAIPTPARYRIAVETSGLDFIDSSGLGVLVGAAKRATAGGGGLCLVGAQERVLRIFRITGLVRVIPAFGTLEEAFAWLDEQRLP